MRDVGVVCALKVVVEHAPAARCVVDGDVVAALARRAQRGARTQRVEGARGDDERRIEHDDEAQRHEACGGVDERGRQLLRRRCELRDEWQCARRGVVESRNAQSQRETTIDDDDMQSAVASVVARRELCRARQLLDVALERLQR